MLNAGSLTVTLTSRRSGQHVTLRFKAKCKDGSWQRCAFEQATHVFVTDYDGEALATYYPDTGMLRFTGRVTEAVKWSIQAILRYLAGQYPTFKAQAEIMAADTCGRCSRPLTDPESIERGVGPECYGMATGSRPVVARAA